MKVKIFIQSHSPSIWGPILVQALPDGEMYEFIENIEGHSSENLIIFTDSINPFFVKKWGNKKNVFFFYLTKGNENIPQNILDLSNFAGLFDSTQNLSNYKVQLRLIFKHFENDVQFQDYKAVEKTIEEQIKGATEGAERLKKIYRKLVPLRVNSWKNFIFTSRFQAGVGSGGEFFDYKIGENSISFYSISTANSQQLIDFIGLMENKSISIDSIFHERFLGSDFLFLEIELSTLKIRALNRGGFKVVYQGNSFEITKEKDLKLRPGEDLYILSKGLIQNIGSFDDKFDFDKRIPIEDFFDEVFLEAKGNKRYLSFDGFMLNIQVGKNALFKV
jgi:hypothetical protein